MEVILSLQDGAFSYDDKEIFSNLSFEVFRGEVLCILGANGCGKTTLLRCLNGILKLKRGNICFNGADISTMSVVEIARNMGFVFQEHSAPFPFTVLEVVLMGRTPYLGIFDSPSAKDVIVAEQALETVGLLHFKDKPYTQISGGERQLVLIARSISQKPQMIIFDEPTSHLDLRNQTLVLRTVQKLARDGITVVMTTHLPNQALLHSTRVALMNRGTFIAIGEANQVMTEENLSNTYDAAIKIVNATKNGRNIKLCVSDHDLEEVD